MKERYTHKDTHTHTPRTQKNEGRIEEGRKERRTHTHTQIHTHTNHTHKGRKEKGRKVRNTNTPTRVYELQGFRVRVIRD